MNVYENPNYVAPTTTSTTSTSTTTTPAPPQGKQAALDTLNNFGSLFDASFDPDSKFNKENALRIKKVTERMIKAFERFGCDGDDAGRKNDLLAMPAITPLP